MAIYTQDLFLKKPMDCSPRAKKEKKSKKKNNNNNNNKTEMINLLLLIIYGSNFSIKNSDVVNLFTEIAFCRNC